MGQGRRGDKTDSDSDREPEPIEIAMQLAYQNYLKNYKLLREHRRELQRSFSGETQLTKALRKRHIVKAENAFQDLEKDARAYIQWYLELEKMTARASGTITAKQKGTSKWCANSMRP
jgi:hypothetical protein